MFKVTSGMYDWRDRRLHPCITNMNQVSADGFEVRTILKVESTEGEIKKFA